MTDRDTQAAMPTAQALSTDQSAATRPKRKTKSRRRTPRRRDGPEGSDGGASDAGDDNASSSQHARKPKPASALFPGISSTTPTAWADMDVTADSVSFEEFSRGPESTRGGRGGSSAARGWKPRHDSKASVASNNNTTSAREINDANTNDEDRIRSAEERARLKRERQKAKRKETKDKQRRTTASKEPESKDNTADAVSAAADDVSFAASTSALTLDDTAGLNRDNRAAHSQRVPEDPKFTPRAGNFWMHDQRHNDEGSFPGGRPGGDSWRGRGARGGGAGMPRGSFRGGVPRGRGRGAFGSFGSFAAGPSAGRVQTPPAPPSSSGSVRSGGGRRMMEMDKLELVEHALKDNKSRPGNGSSSDRWGHEGFQEQASTQDSFRNNRVVRGRGRGLRAAPRGAAAAASATPSRTFAPANLPTPEASPDRSKPAEDIKPAEVIKPSELTTTQSAADDLLADAGAVTVRLPGDAKVVEVEPRPPAEAAAPSSSVPLASVTSTSQASPAPQSSPFPPAFTPSNPSPVPYGVSESGSISSGYIPPASVPPVPMAPEFYPRQTNFRPPVGPGFVPRNFSPQSFTPELGMQPAPNVPQPHPGHQQRSSFSGHAAPFYPSGATNRPRSGSPLNPYAGQMFFMPARPTQKVHMLTPGHAVGADGAPMPRSPTSDGTDSTLGLGGVEAYPMPGYYYNPYSGMPEHGGLYYPPQAGYWAQTGYESMGAYGYEGGEYPGY